MKYISTKLFGVPPGTTIFFDKLLSDRNVCCISVKYSKNIEASVIDTKEKIVNTLSFQHRKSVGAVYQ